MGSAFQHNRLRIKTEDITRAEERYFGELVHLVMELWLRERIDISAAIDRIIVQAVPWWNREKMKQSLEEFLFEVKNAPDFEKLVAMMNSGTPLAEVAVLGEGGERLRVDLIIETPNKFVVIDYKIGTHQEIHNAQLKRYCQIISRTGKKTEGYLFYLHGANSRLVKVV